MAPRSAPGAPRSGPRGAKTAPGAARSAPGAPNEPPEAKKRSKKEISYRFCSWVAFGRPPGAILERFWRLLGGILEPFSIDFRAYSCRILAAVFFLLSAVVRFVWLRARAGKPEEREREAIR